MTNPRRRAEIFATAKPDRRFSGPATGDERRMFVDFLRAQRATLELKCAGVDGELSRRSVEPSTLSLLGLVRQLADVERRWFRRVLAGQDAPPLFSSAADPDGDFDGAASDPAVVAAAWDAWRTEVDFAERLVADAPNSTSRVRTPGARRCRCVGYSSTWSRSTPGTTDTPTYSASGSTERSECEAPSDVE
ncbi:hypothetical protein GCM10009753_01970 [Streptantibioticus ferralitis]